MKEIFQRVYYFKVQSEQKQRQWAGIERATLMSISERSTLRASMLSAFSMALWVSGAAIEHHHHDAAAESVLLDTYF